MTDDEDFVVSRPGDRLERIVAQPPTISNVTGRSVTSIPTARPASPPHGLRATARVAPGAALTSTGTQPARSTSFPISPLTGHTTQVVGTSPTMGRLSRLEERREWLVIRADRDREVVPDQPAGGEVLRADLMPPRTPASSAPATTAATTPPPRFR